MAIFSIAVRTSITTVNAQAAIVTGANNRINVLECGATQVLATASTIGLGHAVAGTTLGTTANGIPEDMSGPTSTVQIGTTWSTQPTTPTSFFRRASFGATVGSGIIWTFPRGIVIPVSNNFCMWNILTGSSTFDTWLVWDE